MDKLDAKEIYQLLEQTDDVVEQVSLLNQLTAFYINSDLDRCQAEIDRIIEISEPIGYKDGMAQAYHGMARIASRSMKHDEAIAHLKHALDILETTDDLLLKARVLDSLGVSYSHNGDFKLSINSSKLAGQLYDEAKEPQGLKANCLNNIANSYARMGDMEKAESYYTEALNLLYDTGNAKHATNLRVNLALIQTQKGNYEVAIPELLACLKIYENVKHKLGVAKTLMSIAHAYRLLNEYADAVAYYLKAIPKLKEVDDKESLVDSYLGLAKVYISLAGWREALSQVDLSSKVLSAVSYPNGNIEMLRIKALIFEQLNENEQATSLKNEATTLAEKYGINIGAINF